MYARNFVQEKTSRWIWKWVTCLKILKVGLITKPFTSLVFLIQIEQSEAEHIFLDPKKNEHWVYAEELYETRTLSNMVNEFMNEKFTKNTILHRNLTVISAGANQNKLKRKQSMRKKKIQNKV